MEKQNYIAPCVEALNIQIEQGFAASEGDAPDYDNGGHLGPNW